MDTSEIQLALQTNSLTKPIFVGVFPSNHIPNNFYSTLKDKCVVFNFDENDEPGSHWVVMYKTATQYIEYFDPYGLPPIHEHIYEKAKGKIRYNIKQLQSNESVFCGLYCLYFVYKKALGYKLQDIVRPFTENYTMNDSYVKATVCDKFYTDINLCNNQL